MDRSEWLERRDGRLGAWGRLQRVAQGALVQLGFGRQSPGRVCEDVVRLRAAIVPPASPAIAAAQATVAAVSEPWLVDHCMRTWAWGAALGEVAGLRFDRELSLLAALLHDLGLTAAFAPQPGQCFAVAGARAARRWATEAGLEPQRVERLAAAVTLHLEVRVAVRDGIEAHLLHAGAMADVLGARLDEIPAAIVGEVLAEHPRATMAATLPAVLRCQADSAPATRIALYCQRFAFDRRIEKAALRGHA